MDIRQHARAEIGVVNRTLANHGVDAGTAPAWTTIAGESYIIYELKLGRQATVDHVAKRLPELQEALSASRRDACPVRLRTMPLALEVAHPYPAPLRWQTASLALPPATMLAGRSYGGTSQQETVSFERSPHALIAGTTGSGKSTLLLMALLTLCLNTDPADLELHLVDLKNEDLVPLRVLPHVRSLAVSPEQAGAAIVMMQQLKTARVDAGRGPYLRTVLAIDELAQVADVPGALAALGDVLMIGRSKGINVIAATQKPTKAVVGSQSSANFTTRLIGRVVDVNEAVIAGGRGGTGAHLLPTTGGAFLRIEGAEPVRFQAYYVDGAGVRDLIRAVLARWGKAQPVTVVDERKTVATAPGPVAATVAEASPAARENFPPGFGALVAAWVGADGRIKYGGTRAMLQALYGPVAALNGRNYTEQCAELQRMITQYLTQTRQVATPAKIVSLHEWQARQSSVASCPATSVATSAADKGGVAS